MHLNTAVSKLHGVGEKLERAFGRLGIETASDLLYHFPFRYEDFSEITDIAALREDTQTTVRGKIELISARRSPRKRTYVTEALIADGTGQLRAVWFGQPFIAKTLKAGDEVFLSGAVKQDVFGAQMISPGYEKVKEGETMHTARIVPLYPLTHGLTHKQMRYAIKQALPAAAEVADWLPADIADRADVMPLAEALQCIHFPESADDLLYATNRLKFDELFILQLRAEMIRQSLKREHAPRLPFHEKEIRQFVADLPFLLTNDQKIAAWEILKDCEKPEPMNRLLQGDVGSGKTVVAALAACNTALCGFQVAVMAPTEILARQHFCSFSGLLPQTNILLVTGSEIEAAGKLEISGASQAKRRELARSLIESGEAEIVVGTHALLTDTVRFHNLGLVIVDEQHRFGVEQRRILRERSGDPNTAPHFLSMTATPIPRSLSLTLYGDLEISTIRGLPGGRKPVKTRLTEPHNREKAYAFIREQVKKGRQVFVVCPLIQETAGRESEKKTVSAEYQKLSQDIFPDLRIGYLHGKMPVKEKDAAIDAFALGQTEILVSTSVVEVGLDIPNASVMMIEDAERFGLAQLHQFRGRVGRSIHQSYCFVFTCSDSRDVAQRLAFFEKNNDGFVLAQYDLERRGPGEVYGTAQSGMMRLRLATLQDADIIRRARELARGLDFEHYPALAEKVKEWENAAHLE